MKAQHPERYGRFVCRVPYGESRQTCDIVLSGEWLIEVKMARFLGDNGKPDDTGIKDVISPFDTDRSALTDTVKLLNAGGSERKAVLIYGFDAPKRPLAAAIAAFETLARARVKLGPRIDEPFAGLVHPVHQSGAVFAWEIAKGG